MSQLWWQLPGPGRMLDRIERDIRDGKNIVILLPEYGPTGISSAIQKRVKSNEAWPWYELELCTARDLTPAEAVVSRFVVNRDREASWNSRYLVSNEEFRGQLIWIEGFTESTWPAWCAFITEYSHACRTLQAHERSLFIICVSGNAAQALVQEDICLSVYKWDGWVEQTDMLLYAAHRCKRNGLTRIQHVTVLTTIARLALWDPNTADLLCNENMTSILRPNPVLRQLALERRWDTYTNNKQSWWQGMIAEVEGKTLKHSALLALNDPTRELEARVWSAEVGAILPYIEEQRRWLLQRLAGQLRVPWTGRFGQINDVRDLEIGHIEAQVYQYRLPVDSETMEFIRRLRKIRNKLSHLEPLDPDMLVL